MEFRLQTDLSALQPQAIDFNFEQLKTEIAERTGHYAGLVVTEDGIKDAKGDLANLRKLSEAIDAQRKEVKTACLRPYVAFEAQCKQLTDIIGCPIAAIDGQIKAYEERKKEDKREEITAFFMTSTGDVAPFLPLSRLWNPRWLNAGYKMQDVQNELEAAIILCRKDVESIRGLDSPFVAELLEQYAQSGNLSAVLDKARALKARQEAEAARKAAVATPTPVAQAAPTAPVAPQAEVPPMAEPIHAIDFRVWATDAQLAALKSFLLQNQIKYGKVD